MLSSLLDFTNSVEKKQQVWSFADHLDLKGGKALCLHRWKIWWSIPKLLKSRKCPEADIPPETYFLLSQFQVTTLLQMEIDSVFIPPLRICTIILSKSDLFC
jgi:hypothetical protein